LDRSKGDDGVERIEPVPLLKRPWIC
jgi:hypothetical protein